MKNYIDISHGTEGPAFDPYAVDTISFTDIHGTDFELRMGMLCRFSVNGKVQSESYYPKTDDEVIKEWEEATGLTVSQAQHIHEKYFYFEDPMGSPSMYI